MNLEENAQRIREEVVEHLTAPPVKPGKRDLLLMPNHLMLTIHESVAHPTELDRALGYEANYAGTSYITPDKIGKRIASEHCTFVGDRTSPRALATVRLRRRRRQGHAVDHHRQGHLQELPDHARAGRTWSARRNRTDAARPIAGPPSRSSACPTCGSRPDPRETTLESLIAGIDDGVLIDGRGSYSIDQQRYNFQFGGDAFWEIKGGKKRGMISRVSYQARTPDFWQACDGTAGPAYWRQYGTTGDAKGEPTQINSISHGCAPTRFRGINVILTD